ncbi:MAG: hypothetical protein A3H42_05955 [Deltaproteobacteria bacterium RIFCSPLOWO2_02_FULL_46_8]|nr:MAG: hypothetical protein A3H42_05955 [Deltaproteobacteria bacterium RIFCSPLOWO2_02_FULL_46_8]
MKQKTTVAFITYKGLREHDDKERVLQPNPGWNSHREHIGTHRITRRAFVLCKRSSWKQLRSVDNAFKHFVVYVGRDYAALDILNEMHIPAQKLTFIKCSCGYTSFKKMIATHPRWQGARLINSGCGGYDVLEVLFDHFMKTGRVDAPILAEWEDDEWKWNWNREQAIAQYWKNRRRSKKQRSTKF